MEDYKCLFKEYAKTLPNFDIQFDNLYSLLNSNVRIAIMCFEKEPEMCHRHVIKDYLSNMYTIRSADL